MIAAVAIVAAFLLGSIPTGLLVARAFFGTDLRTQGSGNIGAANALRTLGRGAGAAVLVVDALKGFIPVALVSACLADPSRSIAMAAGFAAITGHCYSPWLRFRGGKGVATALGAALALSWPAGLVFVAAWLVTGLGTGYSSVGSLCATVLSGAMLGWLFGIPGTVYAVCSTAVIVWRHRENLERLREGTENHMRPPAPGQASSASKRARLS